MSWKNILKEESVKGMVEDALDLHSRGRDFYKETYTKEDIKQMMDFFKKENKRDRLDQFDTDYNSKAIRLLGKALEELQ